MMQESTSKLLGMQQRMWWMVNHVDVFKQSLFKKKKGLRH